MASRAGDHADPAHRTAFALSYLTYRDLYKPFHKTINDFLHRNTPWKTFIHSCGAIRALIPEFIMAGFDILNPIQCSAAAMDAADLKREFGPDIVFWGGGVDTQKTLPFGTPDEVYEAIQRGRASLMSSFGKRTCFPPQGRIVDLRLR